MRRRDRWRNLPWLQWVEGDTGEGAIAHSADDLPPIHESLTTLVGGYARYVDLERDGSVFRVRILPVQPGLSLRSLNFGACYTGPCLERLLAMAVVDLSLTSSTRTQFAVGSTEKWRWVPC